MTAPAAALDARDIALRHPGAAAPLLEGFSLALAPGEIVAILGPSGIGKSSLLRVLGGLEQPVAGTVTVAGARLAGVHPRVAIAFQSAALLPWRSLERNVAFGLDFKRQPALDVAERRQRVDRAIAEVGLDHARRRWPSELSGGMAQRAALARCLARQPQVLLLDEPFGALDAVTRASMQRLLLKIVADYGTAALLITHDIDEALVVADRLLLLGGAPAATVGEWRIDDPHPRDPIALGGVRAEILGALRTVMQNGEVDDGR